MKVIQNTSCLLLMLLLFGCGSGSLTTTPQASSTRTYSVTGSDTAGGAYSGTLQYITDGQTTIDGRNVNQKRYIRTLTKIGASTENPYFEYNLL
jgi:hypothetical protein